MVYLGNAFSAGMISSFPADVRFEEITQAEAKSLLSNGFVSAIGHKATADFLSTLLGVDVVTNRVQITLTKNDMLIILQLLERLPEGKVLTTDEVKEIKYKLIKVTLK